MEKDDSIHITSVMIRRSRNFKLVSQSTDINMSVHDIVNKCIEKALNDWNNDGYIITSKFYIKKEHDPYFRRQFYIRMDLYEKLIPISEQLCRTVPMIIHEIVIAYHMSVKKEQPKYMKKRN